MSTTTPTTAETNQELRAALGGITQCRYSLRQARRLIDTNQSIYPVESLHDAIDALSVSVESLAKVVQAQVKP